MQIIKVDTTQNQFLHDYLRGTGQSLTEYEARTFFNIQNLRARVCELRHAGLRIRTLYTDRGTAYAVSNRDIFGSRAKLFLDA